MQYERGTLQADTNIRVDTVTNNRPGIVLKKQDWNGNALPGAAFTLRDEDGNEIGSFTSDAEGLITTAFLRDDADYTLTETRAPQGYHGLEAPVSIRLHDGIVSVEGVEEIYYTLEQEEGSTPTLTLKNRPFRLRAVKMGLQADGTAVPLAGVPFALHREVRIDTVTSMELTPLADFEKLVSEEETGLIPKVSEALPARTYYLVESEVPEGYRQPDEHVRFTISETGQVTLTENPLASLSEEVEEPDGGLVYTITVRNQPEAAALRVIKTDQGGLPLEEAVFTLTGPEEEKELVSRIPDGGKDAVILADDNMQEGTYTLTETKAPEGYILPEDPVIIRVKKTDKGMTVTASVNGTELEYPQLEQDRDTGDWTLRIVNQGGYELPATGGPGTGMFRLAGFLLLLLAGALQLRRRADRY